MSEHSTFKTGREISPPLFPVRVQDSLYSLECLTDFIKEAIEAWSFLLEGGLLSVYLRNIVSLRLSHISCICVGAGGCEGHMHLYVQVCVPVPV